MTRLLIVALLPVALVVAGWYGLRLYVTYLDTPPAGFHGSPNCGVPALASGKTPGTPNTHFFPDDPATLERHGAFVIPDLRPSEVRIEYYKSEMLLCHGQWFMRISLDWHYCGRERAGRSRGLKFEEIAFPEAREIWLSDTLYAELGDGADFPGGDRQQSVYGMEWGREAPADEWTVRPYSEALPRTISSWLVCRLTERN